MKPLLKLENVSSFIGPFHILQGVSLEVFPGEAVVVLGAVGDRYYIINEGRTVLSGDVKELYHDEDLQRKYLGVVSA